MSTIGQAFESGEQTGLKGHFRNLVMLARASGKVEESEKKLLDRMARRLALTEAQVSEIKEHEEDYPMIPPYSTEERFERFIRFVQMAMVDGTIDAAERKLVLQLGVALGMDENTIETEFEKVVKMWLNGMDVQEMLDILVPGRD